MNLLFFIQCFLHISSITEANSPKGQLQQDYLDNVSKLEFLEAEYNRQTELAKENVNAQKAFQQSKSQFESTKAAVKGLELNSP